MLNKIVSLIGVGALALSAFGQTPAASTPAAPATSTAIPSGHKKDTFKVGTSIYTGWEFWEYLRVSGLMDKWAATYGIKIEIVPFNLDYLSSIGAFTAGDLDAVTITNMDLLTGPAMSGDVTVPLVGDYSDGNDGWGTRDGLQLSDMRGVTVIATDDSVSEYTAYRAFEKKNAGIAFTDLGGITNMSDSQIANALGTDNGATKAFISWEPILTTARELTGPQAVSYIFTSAEIPEEILDLLAIHTRVAQENPDFCKALAGAFYEALAITYPGREQAGVDAKADEAIRIMADHCGVSPEQFRKMLGTTAMYWKPQEAVDFTRSARLQERMTTVRNTCLALAKLGGKNGLGFSSVNPRELAAIGIQFPDGKVIGPKDKVAYRFDTTYMQLAAEGKLVRTK